MKVNTEPLGFTGFTPTLQKKHKKYAEKYPKLARPVIFIGVCCINRWKEILIEQLKYIQESDLLMYVQEIHINTTGEGYSTDSVRECLESISTGAHSVKVIVKHHGDDILQYERPYLVDLQEYADLCKCATPILYMHSKGVTRQGRVSIPGHISTDNWRQYMQYFLVKKWKSCLYFINNGSDAVGCNFNEEPTSHFSGNFWWASSEHIKNLPSARGMPWNMYEEYGKYSSLHHRYMYEFWIGRRAGSSLKEIWMCSWDHYNDPLPEEVYAQEGDLAYKNLEWEED